MRRSSGSSLSLSCCSSSTSPRNSNSRYSYSNSTSFCEHEHEHEHEHVDLKTTTNLELGLSMNGDGESLFVKVYMEGHPIGRKLDIMAHRCYQQLITTLDQMFNANILWGEEVDGENSENFHVLTYEDEEGDWLMVGDVPWEMFLSTVKRLKITRACPC